MDKETLREMEEPIINSSQEIQNIIRRVLKAESDKLYQAQPRVVDDIVEIIKEEVRNEDS